VIRKLESQQVPRAGKAPEERHVYSHDLPGATKLRRSGMFQSEPWGWPIRRVEGVLVVGSMPLLRSLADLRDGWWL